MKSCGAKDMSGEIAQAYSPQDVESGWYDWWEKQGYFKPVSDADPAKAEGKPSYTIVLPPPNVTGSLHLGHALTSAVQDTLIRWHRMKGDNTLYVPGLDHAGIATQVVVEKKLKVEENKTRHDLGREEFVKRVWQWKEQYGNNICNQLRKTGASLEWDRLAFSMDEPRNEATVEAFVRLYDKGLITRSTRLINWCSALRSAISDIEVEYIDAEPGTRVRVPGYDKTVELGYLYEFAYKVVDSDEEIVVATTRPETILGDTAVAVHPEDPRYTHLHGKKLQCPFRDDTIPLITDATLVDMTFGTGAVKITPAHDPNDFEAGNRHNLPQISVFTEQGLINENGAPFVGMQRFECRKAIEKALKEKGLEKGRKAHSLRVGVCSRTGDIIEPFLKPQWFVNCTDVAARAVKAVDDGELRLVPDSHNGTWKNWLNNIRPWCISRQLWWGHRVPAWYATVGERDAEKDEDVKHWVVARTEEEAKEKAIKQLGLEGADVEKLVLSQDPDVLDTWFSAGLHPMYTLGWPNVEHPDYQKFFSTSLLETGHDILFFWVARMVMMSLALTDRLPFAEVYLHAMVRDKEGRKMSKSLGNVVDPLDVVYGIKLEDLQAKLKGGNLDANEIEKAAQNQKKSFPKGIPECGSDALRFGLLSYTVSGKNVNLDIERVVSYRHFCNKLWNAIRFGLFFSLGTDYCPPARSVPLESLEAMPFPCRWILSRLDKAIIDVNKGFTNYEFANTITSAYNFWLYDFCDVFLELTKPAMKLPEDHPDRAAYQFALWVSMEVGLRLLHPMLPFVTEELWHRLPGGEKWHPTESLIIADFPTEMGYRNEAVEKDMEVVKEVIHAVRSSKSNMQMTNKDKPDTYVVCRNEDSLRVVSSATEQINFLAMTGEVKAVPAGSALPSGCVSYIVDQHITMHLMVKGMINPDQELTRLSKKKKTCEKDKAALEKKMNAPNYEDKVPQNVRESNTERSVAMIAELKAMDEAIAEMTKLKEESA